MTKNVKIDLSAIQKELSKRKFKGVAAVFIKVCDDGSGRLVLDIGGREVHTVFFGRDFMDLGSSVDMMKQAIDDNSTALFDSNRWVHESFT